MRMSHRIRRHKIARDLIEPIKRYNRAHARDIFFLLRRVMTEIWERIPPYRLPAAFRPLTAVIYEAAMDPRSQGYEPPNWFESFLGHNAG